MTTRTIKGALRTVIFGGAVALLPAAASAQWTASGDQTSTPVTAPTVAAPSIPSASPEAPVPTHEEAQVASSGEAIVPVAERSAPVPDHQEAEEGGSGAPIVPTLDRIPGPPDHQTAQDRGVSGNE
jgi:hypothetical protein